MACVHHWKLDPPSGGRVKGYCAKCGVLYDRPDVAPLLFMNRTVPVKRKSQEKALVREPTTEKEAAVGNMQKHNDYVARKEEILQVCETKGWVMTRAAVELEMATTTLIGLMKEWKIDYREKKKNVQAPKYPERECPMCAVMEQTMGECQTIGEFRMFYAGLKKGMVLKE